MNPLAIELLIRHRHGDGSWSPMEESPAHHDAAAHDAERTWGRGRIFRCTRCAEEILVDAEPGQSLPAEDRP